MGEDMDYPPVTFPSIANHEAPLSNVLWALFDVLWKTLIYLGLVVRWEQYPTASEFMLCSQDLPLGVPLCAVPSTSVLRQCIQMLHHLGAEPDFAVDFCLPFPVASS